MPCQPGPRAFAPKNDMGAFTSVYLLVFVMTGAVYTRFYPFVQKMVSRGVQYDSGVYTNNYGTRKAAEGTILHGLNWVIKMMTKNTITCNH